MRKHQNWLKAYADFTRDNESPTSFHFWTGVSTIAGVLRRRVWIDMRKFVWTPNFYIILVAPAGIAAKSTSVGIGYRLLSRIPGVNFGPESLTWQALADSLYLATEGVKYTGSDGLEHIKSQSAITVFISELGTFLPVDDDKFISFLIRVWDGQEDTFQHKTRTSGTVDVLNPWLNIIGCTTPSWLATNFKETMIGGGLTSRIIFVHGESKRMFIPYPDEVVTPDEYHRIEQDLTDDLRAISQLSGEYNLSSDARIWGRDWYQRLWNSPRPAHMASERYSGYIARKQTHIHKLAMVLAAAKREKLIIEKEDLEEAEVGINGIEPDMIRVFNSIGLDKEAARSREIVSIVHTYGWIGNDALYHLCMNTMALKDFDSAVTSALRGGILDVQSRGGKPGYVIPLSIGDLNVRSAS